MQGGPADLDARAAGFSEAPVAQVFEQFDSFMEAGGEEELPVLERRSGGQHRERKLVISAVEIRL